MLDYYSPLLLPSNGLEYSPIIYLKELTVGSVMIHYDNFYVNSEINKIIAIINNHFKHKEISDISDMYYGDAIYVWNYLCNKSFDIKEIKKIFVCKKCEEKKTIKIHLKDIEIEYLNDKDIELEYKINDNFSILYRRRKMIDNIYFSFFSLEEEKESLDFVFNYAKNQIIGIKDIKKNKIFPKNKFKDFLKEIGIKKTLIFFEAIRQEDFSFKSDYIAICDSCGNKNEIKLIDPLDISFFNMNLEVNENNYEKYLEMGLTINSLKYMSLENFLNVPHSKADMVIETVRKLQEQKYNKNKGSYFDQVMDDM